MVKEIEPKLKKISEFLRLDAGEKFVVPDFQRGYEWDSYYLNQCDKLLQDIEQFIASNGQDPYFFGTIITDCTQAHQYSLIDGQQRTTTFLLLIKALQLRLTDAVKRLRDDRDSEAVYESMRNSLNTIIKILYHIDDEKLPEFRENPRQFTSDLYVTNAMNELYPDQMKVILNGNDFDEIKDSVQKIKHKKNDNRYTNHFRNFKFFYERITDMHDSELKEFAKTVLDKSQVIEIRSWNVDMATAMFNALNSTGLPLYDADIISAAMHSNAGDRKAEFVEKWRTLRQRVDALEKSGVLNMDKMLIEYMYIQRSLNNDNDTTTPGMRRYFTNINPALLRRPMEMCADLEKIVAIWEKIAKWAPIVVLGRLNENYKMFLISYLFKFDLEDVTYERVMQMADLLMKLFAVMTATGTAYSSAKVKTFLFEENMKLVKDTDLAEVSQDFTKHVTKEWSKQSVFDYLMGYRGYDLVYLNEYLYARAHGIVLDIDKNVTVEHIMPQSGRNISIIRKDAGIDTVEEFNDIVEMLGNKILLEANINTSIGNEWFKTKKNNTIPDNGYKDSKYPIAVALTGWEQDTWTPKDISDMTERVATRITDFIFS